MDLVREPVELNHSRDAGVASKINENCVFFEHEAQQPKNTLGEPSRPKSKAYPRFANVVLCFFAGIK